MESNYKRLGNYIQQVDVRNTDLEVDLLLGVSIDKKFIESHANTVGTDFSKYKIVKKGQFAYGPVTSRNGDKISIALLKEADSCLVSSSYTPFEITKPEELNADYLMLLFSNPEFDRYARYNSWGSAREVFSWDDFCDSMLYIPDITEQEKIVRQYKTIVNRIDVLEKINDTLKNKASIVLKEKLYKSDNYTLFENIIELFDSMRKPLSGTVRDEMKNKIYPYYGAADLMDYVEDYIFDGIYGLIAEDGSVSNELGNPTLQYVWGKFWVNNHAHIFQGKNGYSTELVYFLIKDIDIREYITGAVQLKINQENLKAIQIHIPNEDDLNFLNELSQVVFSYIRANCDEILNLKAIQKQLLIKIN